MLDAWRSDEVVGLARRMHAATEELTRLVADLDDSKEWSGTGLSTCAHWLSMHAGFELWTGGAFIHVGRALRSLPLIREAFAEGSLSFDKVRALVEVATPEDERVWLDVGLHGSGSQVARICRAFRRSMVTDDPDRGAAQLRKRRLVSWLRPDGMLDVFATLPPEDGAVLLNALEVAMSSSRDAQPPEAVAMADQPGAARRADALVAICERYLSGGDGVGAGSRAVPRLVVHVDADVLGDGASAEGRCHIEDGPALAASAARRIACDAEVETVVERDGVPVAVTDRRRLIRGRERRLMQLRDQTCRYPGCTVPSRRADGHHIEHWVESRDSSLPNVLSLCRFHHHRQHDGEFNIVKRADGGVDFVTPSGEPIGPLKRSPG